MAVNYEEFAYHPKRDLIHRESWPNATIHYDDVSDTLFVRLDPSRTTTSIPVGDYEYILVDPTDEQVVGIQIEYYLARAVSAHPKWLELAELAGIGADAVAEARARIGESALRHSVIRAVLADVEAVLT